MKKLKKNEKIGIIESLILIIMGIVGLIYTTIIDKNSYSAEITLQKYGAGVFFLILGIILFIYFILLSKNKKKSDEQQNICDDERLNNNKNLACAVSFKFLLSLSIISDYIVTFFLTQYSNFSESLNNVTILMIIVYSISYAYISKKN